VIPALEEGKRLIGRAIALFGSDACVGLELDEVEESSEQGRCERAERLSGNAPLDEEVPVVLDDAVPQDLGHGIAARAQARQVRDTPLRLLLCSVAVPGLDHDLAELRREAIRDQRPTGHRFSARCHRNMLGAKAIRRGGPCL